jgi:FG-GAP repeat
MNPPRGQRCDLSSSAKLPSHFSRPFLIVCLLVGFVTAAQATVLLDPLVEPSTTQFGYALASLGDINGDGVPDFAVGAPFQDGDFVSTDPGFGLPANVGKVFVIDGATLAVLSIMNDPDFELIQPQHFGGQLGASISVSADINGDGVPDLIAGVPQYIVHPENKSLEAILGGKALVFSGKDGALLFTLNDPTAEEDGRCGAAVAALGDVNADGTVDFAVGVPGKDIGGEDGIANVGLVYIFSGKTGALLRTLNDPPRGGAEAGAGFGSAIANAGDVNGDGVTDVFIGAPGEGRAYLFNGKSGALLLSIVSPVHEAVPSFGYAVSGGQDFNRDRKPDLVVGAPLQNNFAGAAYVFDGTSGALLNKLKSPTPQIFARFGASVLASADITGDRRADIIVGAPDQNVNGFNSAGEAFVFDGQRGRVRQTLMSETPQTHAGFGTGLTSAVFPGNRAATAVIGVPYQDANSGGRPHLEMGQIEIPQ